MGTRGPVPKRSDQRVRRNKPEGGSTETVTAIGPVEIPELGFEDPHPIVVDFYESLADSAQSKFYEPSDWQYARLTLHFVDELLKYKTNGQVLATVNQMLSALLVSEGDRRRVQIEVDRNKAEGVVVDVAQVFRERLGMAQQG